MVTSTTTAAAWRLTRLMNKDNVSMSKKGSHCPFFEEFEEFFGSKFVSIFVIFYLFVSRLVLGQKKVSFVAIKLSLNIKN